MSEIDPFIVGLRRVLELRPDLNPARLGKIAGLSDSTVRKMLAGQSKTPTHASAQKLARALGLSVQQVIDAVQGQSIVSPAAAAAAGLAEDAAPFAGASQDEATAVRTLFAQAGRNVVITHRAAVWVPDWAIAPGDLIVCDLARLPEPGELALVTQTDDTGHSVSLIRRYLPPWLVPSGPPGTALLQVSDPGVAVRHPVVGIIRTAK
jgi:transcriptional regulator with XRE-family HTH domain